MMASSMEQTPVPLRGKLNHVKSLLDGANRRLQEEASKYEIFATKASAVGASMPAKAGKQNGLPEVPADLRRTISDISTIQSVLSCPIFAQIVNVTDSLDKLSYHLNLRPSIGPVDINIDSNGELILAPPIEPTSLNNLINSRLDDFSNQSPTSNSPRISSSNAQDAEKKTLNGNVNGSAVAPPTNIVMDHRAQPMRASKQTDVVRQAGADYELQQDENNPRGAIGGGPNYSSPSCDDLVDQQPSSFTSNSSGLSPVQQLQVFNNEKLVSSGSGTNQVNGNRRQRDRTSKVQSVAAVFENHIAESSENRRLYKANGNFALNQMDLKNRSLDGIDKPITSNQTEMSHEAPMETLGYTNDMYKTTHELTDLTGGVDVVDHKQMTLPVNTQNIAYANNPLMAKPTTEAPVGKRTNTNQRVSPSTSAGSTAPLADDCDSGTSSFRSQAAKGTLYSPQSHKPIPQLEENSQVDSSLDQELIEKLSPDMERIKVTLERDSGGLGITIAGYICEREEISGIFIKSITPGSPADRSGRIRKLDQIFAVNGQEILGYSNAEAVNVLRSHTSPVVTLDLMRYLAESKYRKLQKLLNRAEPTSVAQNDSDDSRQTISGQETNNSRVTSSAATDLIKAQPGLGAASPRRTSQSTASGDADQAAAQPIESMYNNTPAFFPSSSQQIEPRFSGFPSKPSAENQTPVAAQRGSSTNKVIETKQGARNTIDIRSPMCQTMATYVNESSDSMIGTNGAAAFESSQIFTDRQKQAAAEEFGQLVNTEKLEWERDVQIVELYRDSSQSLGFTVKDYANPKDQTQSIFMIVLITPGGIAERDGRLSVGDLLVFVDDTNLEGASPNEAVRALKRTSGQVRLGVLKYKRNY